MPLISRVVPLDRFSRVKYLAQYYRESGMIPMKDKTISIKGHSFRNCKVFLARVGVFKQRNSYANNPLERVSASDRASNPEGFVVVSICFPRQRLPPLEQERIEHLKATLERAGLQLSNLDPCLFCGEKIMLLCHPSMICV
jgi:hypothetical protein